MIDSNNQQNAFLANILLSPMTHTHTHTLCPQFFRDEGCNMVEMSCEEHDRQAASTQFVTHTVGRMLGAMKLKSTDINTKGFESLLNLVNNTTNDSFDLYYGLFLYNQNATDELERLEQVGVDRVCVILVGGWVNGGNDCMLGEGVKQRSQEWHGYGSGCGCVLCGCGSGCGRVLCGYGSEFGGVLRGCGSCMLLDTC